MLRGAHTHTGAVQRTLPPCFHWSNHCNSFVWAIWAGLGDADPRQLRLCPRVTEVAGIVFPANSLFQGLQIRVYNDLGDLARGLPPLPLSSAAVCELEMRKAVRLREMTSWDETCHHSLTTGINWSPPSSSSPHTKPTHLTEIEPQHLPNTHTHTVNFPPHFPQSSLGKHY